MRYAIVPAQSWTPEFVKAKVTNDLSVAYDHMVAENRRTGQTMELWNRETGTLLRVRASVVVAAPEVSEYDKALETANVGAGLKLSDAMRKALMSEEGALTGLPGKVNTLRALEARGLVKIDNCSVARLTSAGRAYQRKG